MTWIESSDVSVVGAGASGLAAAIALRQKGWEVQLLEQSTGRKDRFCGEFVSGEAWASLQELGVAEALERRRPGIVRRTQLFAPSGAQFEMPLAPGGWGLTRRTLDGTLAETALALGVRVEHGAALTELRGDPGRGFSLELGDGRRLRTRAVVAAWGKRSGLDRSLGRRWFERPTDWIGIRQKFASGSFGDAVELHMRPGGYCGAVQVEDHQVNLCMLARQRWLDESGGDPAAVMRTVIAQTSLGDRLAGAEPVAGTLQAIAAVSFDSKDGLPPGVFAIGDAAGLVAPFLGAGVANALRAGWIAANFIDRGLASGTVAQEHCAYRAWWRREFGLTQRWSRLASAALSNGWLSEAGVRGMCWAPAIAKRLYRASRADRLALGYGQES